VKFYLENKKAGISRYGEIRQFFKGKEEVRKYYTREREREQKPCQL